MQRAIEFHSTILITTRGNGIVRLLSVIMQGRVGQIDLSLVSKAIAITSPTSIASFISLCHFRRFPITHYRPPPASTLLPYLIVPWYREVTREKCNSCAPRGTPSIYLLGYRASSGRALLARYLKFVAPNLHTGKRSSRAMSRVYHEILRHTLAGDIASRL